MTNHPGKQKYLIFDFDDTITKNDETPSELFKDKNFLYALNQLVKDGKVLCIIATFSTPQRVHDFLVDHEFAPLFNKIYSTNSFNDGKNKILYEITNDYNIKKKSLILIDNEPSNIKKATANGYNTLKVNGDGLSKSDFRRIRKFLVT